MDRLDSNRYGEDMPDSMTWSMRLPSRRCRSEYAARILRGKRRSSRRTPKRPQTTAAERHRKSVVQCAPRQARVAATRGLCGASTARPNRLESLFGRIVRR